MASFSGEVHHKDRVAPWESVGWDSLTGKDTTFVTLDQVVIAQRSVTVNVVGPVVYTNMVLLLFSAGMWALHWGVSTAGRLLEETQ